MNKSEIILQNLLNDPRGAEARKVYRTLKEWFEDEYGLAWTLKELAQVRKDISYSTRDTKQAIRYFFLKEHSAGNIGNRFLSAEEFTLYSRGLYYMAGFQLLNN